MIDFRCKKCDKLLGKVTGNAEIMCPRCGGVNFYNRNTKEIKYTSRLRKSDRSTLSGKRFE